MIFRNNLDLPIIYQYVTILIHRILVLNRQNFLASSSFSTGEIHAQQYKLKEELPITMILINTSLIPFNPIWIDSDHVIPFVCQTKIVDYH